MWVGIGVGIGRNRFATGIFNDYALRVTADGGITEAGQCVDAVTGLLLNASLLLIPSGYKGGKLYAEIPTNGNGDLTWTRGSDAFRTNASGLIQRVPWNLLQQSETFANVAWAAANSSITANSTTAPNGTLTADKIIATAVTGNHFITTASVVQRGQFTFSVFAKASEYSILLLQDLYSGLYDCQYNLSLGTATGTGASIENMGNGWYRCIVTYTSNGSTVSNGLVGSPTTSINYTGDGTSGIYIWGAQLVEGTNAQTYLPTTDRLNFPRLSYMYGSCPSALLEPQRTNLALRSEEFDNASWSKINTSVTSNQTTAPDGNTTADLLIANTTLDQHRIDQTPASSAGTQTLSIYAKAGGYGFVGLRIGLDGALFNLSTGATSLVGVGYTASTELASNGFYRCILTKSVGLVNDVGRVNISDGTAIAANFSGNNTDGVFLWGAQLEQGAYPTTYIPTTSATATRVADSFSRSNIYTNGLISASGGTWFVEFAVNNTNTRDNSQGMFIGDSTNIYTGNQLVILSGSTGTIQFNKVVSGTGTTLYQSSNSQLKFAIKWNGSTADIFANGTKVISATAFTATNMENLIGQSGTPFFVKQMALFNSPLTDAQCQTLTT